MVFIKWIYSLIIPRIMYNASIRSTTNHRIESDTEKKKERLSLVMDESDP